MFNIRAANKVAAMGRGKSMFRKYPQGSPIAALYSIREVSARPLSHDESKDLGFFDNAGN